MNIYLYLHCFGLNHKDLVPVAAPDLVMHYSHTADGVVWPSQIQQVVVCQIPLAICDITNICYYKSTFCYGVYGLHCFCSMFMLIVNGFTWE